VKDLGPVVVALLGGGLIAGIVGIVGHFVTLWNAQREQRGQRETEERRGQQDALQKYIDQMGGLMGDLTQEVAQSRIKIGGRREIAQARTMAVLLGIGPSFKRVIITLVYELGLIEKGDPIIELGNARFDHADFRELNLREAHLAGADLRMSDLKGADLTKSDLTRADLRGANLRRANLPHTHLTNANLLPYDKRHPERLSSHRLARSFLRDEILRPRKLTLRISRTTNQKGRDTWRPIVNELTVTNLSEAVLDNAQLDGAMLGGANLPGVTLREANLTNTFLVQANLKKADLSNAYLSEADLSEADLSGADLSGADLTNVKGFTEEQLEQQAKTLEGATMPNGRKYEDWRRDKAYG
jgi:uncharacterized protein YjbI with pentapeptide repeats